MAQPRVLIIDDEPHLIESVSYNLKAAGFLAVSAGDGEAALERCRRDPPDLVILDLMLPKMDGLEVCRALRQDPKTRHIPVVMLTAKGSETDKIVGLELGADDYLTKPFSPRELVARVKAILRRRADPPAELFTLEALKIDWARHLVTVAGKPVELTSKEFGLLRTLIDAKGRVLNRDQLLERVWGYERSVEIETRTVDLHVSQLRRKLGKAGKRILTVKNAGYRFIIDE